MSSPRLRLPQNLAAIDHAAQSERWRDWIAKLSGTVTALCERWELRLGEPFEPGGECSWVAPATGPAGQRLVLKVGWRHYEAAHEADGLVAWAGNGAVLLIDSCEFSDTSALLLERCLPGAPLSGALPPLEQDAVVADLLRTLWITPEAGWPFRPLLSMCTAWADEFERKHAAADPATRLDSGLVKAGMQLFRELPATAEHVALLATDLHPGNVLAAHRQPWLMIDPKPYTGDPGYDVLQHMLNHPGRLAGDAAGFAERMALLCELDPARVRQWLFARCVQECIDMPALTSAARALAP